MRKSTRFITRSPTSGIGTTNFTCRQKKSKQMMRFPEKYRRHHPLVPFIANDPEGGWFRIPYNSIFINCLATAGRNWEHAAITLSSPNRRILRCPFWSEMQFVKLLFWEAEDCCMQLHPPESEYVNN